MKLAKEIVGLAGMGNVPCCLVFVFLAVTFLVAEDDRVYTPATLSSEVFAPLKSQSPFTRMLNLSDTLVLSGIARVDGFPVLTVLDTEDGSSITVSNQPNDRGWKIAEINAPNQLESATASIAFSGGEIVRVRYDKERLKSTAQRKKFKKQARSQVAAAKARQASGKGHGVPQDRVNMLKKIAQTELPKGYNPAAGKNAEEAHRLHQGYVDRRMAGMSPQQRGAVGMLWKQQTAVNPQMKNRGASFVRILEHVANQGGK